MSTDIACLSLTVFRWQQQSLISAAIVTIEALCQPKIFEKMHRHGDAIREAIGEAAVEGGHQLVTSGTGTAFTVHFGLDESPRAWTDVMKADPAAYQRFRGQMLEHQIQLLPDGRWYVGATHSDKELEKVIPAIRQSMKGIG